MKRSGGSKLSSQAVHHVSLATRPCSGNEEFNFELHSTNKIVSLKSWFILLLYLEEVI